ncbi:hypothetical protein M9H77_36500 [Catharanthus roseus]|uniref:Uncharacterized protein n=1 Tax=Catharanthus roseus TaxID=4058 RepID=A0ACB9ZSD1_CATRO|nr:hypothetical protein M9H77_36500 [Catharanthus roseus]
MDSNRKSTDENPDLNFEAECGHFEIWSRGMERHQIIYGGNFPNLLHRALAYFFGQTPLLLTPVPLFLDNLNKCAILGENQVWILLSEEDKMWDHNLAGFRLIKKTTQIGLGPSSSQPVDDDDEANESYNPSDDEEDEAGA